MIPEEDNSIKILETERLRKLMPASWLTYHAGGLVEKSGGEIP